MNFDFRDSIVCILKQKDETAGTGFVLTNDGLIATCSHLVQNEEDQRKGLPKPERVSIVFLATGEQREARVELDYWRSSDTEDVAILRVDGALPPQVNALPLGASSGTSGHSFKTLGFPTPDPREGRLGKGSIVGEITIQGISVLQLASQEVTTGFSGAPIVDELRQRVVGMVTSIQPPDKYGRSAKTFYITPTETLRNVCSAIQLKDRCPYRGLDAFREKDAAFFFGRQGIVEELVRSLRNDSRFLAVFGPSGCGKSSVVQAGLIPKLQEGAVTNSNRWTIEVLRPTDDSFEQQVALLERSTTGRPTARPGQFPEHRAIIIDQFEELFVSFSKEEYQRIITCLTNILENSSLLTLIIIMRNDFYPLFVQHDRLVRWMQGRLINISPTIKRDEVEDMVKKPAEAVGWHFEDEGLVQIIVNEALERAYNDSQDSGSSAVLPLLEFALTELWERRENGVFTRIAYNNMGGVTGGLNERAKKVYSDFEERLKPLVRRIFTTLVYLGDKNQSIPDTRRRRELTTLFDDVVQSESERNDVYHVVQKLVQERLLVTSRDAESGRVTVEIIHDALLKKWELLRDWIREDRDFLAWRQKLDEKIQDWETSAVSPTSRRDEEKLLRGNELEKAEAYKTNLNDREQDFVNKSKERKRRQSIRQRFWWIALMVALIVIVGASVVVAAVQTQHVKDQQALLNSLPVSVTNLNDHGPGTLRDAIAAALPGGAVTFAKTLRGTIRLTRGELHITKNLTISGPGAQAVSISGNNLTRVFNVSSGLIVSISNLTVRDGSTKQTGNEFSEGYGGGIYNDLLSTLTLVNVVITGNSADFGGGIYNHLGTFTITNSTISHNAARGDGGGIDNEGTLALTRSTVAYNTATQDGGGIKNRNTLLLTNSTIAVNTAGGNGGGILSTESGSSGIIYSTISGNTAQSGGGITIDSGIAVLQASIIAGDNAGRAPDILGTVTLYWPSLIQNTSGGNFFSSPANPQLQNAFDLGLHSIFGKSPLLGPLQNNGGQTDTYALLPGSPAIDQILPNDSDQVCGSNSFYQTDQRGSARLQGSGCDLGAYEYKPV